MKKIKMPDLKKPNINKAEIENYIKSNKMLVMIIGIVLAVAIVFTSVFGIIGAAIKGEKTDCEAEVEAYNSQQVTYSSLATGVSEDILAAQLLDLDTSLAAIIASINLESMLYTDETATFVAKYTAELTQKSFSDIKFKALKKDFPEAYEYLTAQQEAGMTWNSIETIPFGITPGDKNMFIKACGAGSEHMGDTLFDVFFCAPSAYYDALVPALEATHTEKMPSLSGFIFKTGLSSSERVEFLAERILAIIEPVKQSPLTYLCEIIPDFVINYNRACEFINSNEKIAEKTSFALPTIDSIIKQLISALGMTAPDVDYDYLSKMGTAAVGESAGNKGKRVHIDGDREVVFAYLADYITGLFTYGNNYSVVERILTKDLKSDAVQSSPFASVLTSAQANGMIAALMDILAKLEPKQTVDVDAQVEAFNAEPKDHSSLFTWPTTEENVTSLLTSIETSVAEALAGAEIEKIIFTDGVATAVAKLTAMLCEKELSEISFAALKKSFPEAYSYIAAEQAANKTWNDIETIPFGITDGDKDMFIKACGAGAEHFGDALALCLLVDPHSYDEALLPLLEALHTGPMPTLQQFVSGQGLDSAKRMEEITAKVITVLEPVKASPITYLTEILPDLIRGYNHASAALADNTVSPIKLPDINALLSEAVSGIGLTLPEYDFSTLEKLATASVADSGVAEGKRMELKGDREVVFMGLIPYIIEVIKTGGNMSVVVDIMTNQLGIDSSVLDSITALQSGSGATV